MDELTKEISRNLEIVEEQIEKSLDAAGREKGTVRLIIVTKTQPKEVIEAVIRAGGSLLGENYPEETVQKIQSMDVPEHIEWHMIGHLQSRKTNLVLEHFAMLQSLDSVKLAEKLSRRVQEMSREPLPVLLQCNVSGEETKGGFTAWDPTHWDHLLPEVDEILSLPGIRVVGLMTMPPLEISDIEKVRPYFIRLRRLRDYFMNHYPQASWDELSMGTSSDYRIAIEEGATYIRIGTSIVGERKKKNN